MSISINPQVQQLLDASNAKLRTIQYSELPRIRTMGGVSEEVQSVLTMLNLAVGNTNDCLTFLLQDLRRVP